LQGFFRSLLRKPNMPKPRHGCLYENSDGQWLFCPGYQFVLSKAINLPDLSANCQNLLDTGQLFKGHTKFHCVYQAHHQVSLTDSILCHISAPRLESFIAPSSLKQHQSMSSTEKGIWDQAYDEEYDDSLLFPPEILFLRINLKL
jgi:hypothetical protein